MNHSFVTGGSLPRQEDFDAIMAAALDFVDGWYCGDGERIRRSFHPELVKRTVALDAESGEWRLQRTSTAEMMVAWTKEGGGSAVPEAERVYQITVVEVFGPIAMVRCISPEYVDYLHVAYTDEHGWAIVNDLWKKRDTAAN